MTNMTIIADQAAGAVLGALIGDALGLGPDWYYDLAELRKQYGDARFSDNFELAVLHAISGGGQNMARACLTGALGGAQVGLSRIPKRFIQGLRGHEELVSLCQELGALAER